MSEMLMLCYKWLGLSKLLIMLALVELETQAASLCEAGWTSRGATIWALGVRMCTGR
jgi:hypothetical protein